MALPAAKKAKRTPKLNTLQSLQTKAQEREYAITDKRLNKLARDALDRMMAHSEELYGRVEEVVTFNVDKLRPVLSLEEDFKNLKETNEKAVESIVREVRKAYRNIENDSISSFNSLAASTSEELKESIRRIEAQHTREYHFNFSGMPTVTMTNPHRLMPELVRQIQLGHDTALIGPSGSGKTKAAQMVAAALNKPFHFIACSDADMPSKWFGYVSQVTGEYVPTQVYHWFTGGGVLLIDEYDNMRGNIGVNLNAMLDNGLGDFPNGPAMRHPDAICIAAGNTIGRGATRIYRSRNGLDESTIERFDVITWDYDEDLERKLGAVPLWTEFVIAARHAMNANKLEYIISPRATIKGGRLLLSGLAPEQVIERVVCKQWAADDKAKVMRDTQVSDALYRVHDWYHTAKPGASDE